jgi:hypothetical protein
MLRAGQVPRRRSRHRMDRTELWLLSRWFQAKHVVAASAEGVAYLSLLDDTI